MLGYHSLVTIHLSLFQRPEKALMFVDTRVDLSQVTLLYCIGLWS